MTEREATELATRKIECADEVDGRGGRTNDVLTGNGLTVFTATCESHRSQKCEFAAAHLSRKRSRLRAPRDQRPASLVALEILEKRHLAKECIDFRCGELFNSAVILVQP